MKLYGVPLSPYFMRVWLMLHLKGRDQTIDYPGVPGNALGTPEHVALNPVGRIPFAELDDGTVLPESQVIADYLERLYPDPPMRPADPMLAAKVDMICRLLDLYILPELVFLTRMVGRGPSEEERDRIAACDTGLSYLEHFFASEDWAVGDQPSLADCALLPMLFFVGLIQKGAGIDLLEGRPKLSVYRLNMADQDLAQITNTRMQKSLERVRAARAAAQAEQGADG